MPLEESRSPVRRMPLSRQVVLQEAVGLADRAGIESVSMRNLAHELGVVPMALYKHVANKEELLDGMVDALAAEIAPSEAGLAWKAAVRQRILSARRAVLRHPWAPQLIKSRTKATPVVLDYLDSLIGTFLAGGLSPTLTHQVMHALGSRMWGFTLEVFPAAPLPLDDQQPPAVLPRAARHRHISEVALAATPPGATPHGPGCDDQLEFEFGLDVLLEGFERLHEQGWP